MLNMRAFIDKNNLNACLSLVCVCLCVQDIWEKWKHEGVYGRSRRNSGNNVYDFYKRTNKITNRFPTFSRAKLKKKVSIVAYQQRFVPLDKVFLLETS